MSKKEARIPKYRFHKATDRAYVEINGKPIYLGPYGTETSKREYDRIINEWLSNGRRLPGHEAGGITIVELIAAYWRHAEAYYVDRDGNPTSTQHNIRSALGPVKRLYGDSPAREFGPAALKAVRQVYIDKGWSLSTINDSVSKVRTMFRWAVENELVPADVHHALMAVAGLRAGRSEAPEGEPVQPVPDEHVEAIREHVSRQVWAMIELQRLTGMRPGEVCAMRACDIDMTSKVWTYTPSKHKTAHHGHQRTVFIGPKAQRIIEPFLQRDLQAYLFSPAEAEAERFAEQRRNRQSKVQPSQERRAEKRRKRANKRKRKPRDSYDTNSYRRAIHYGCDQAGVPRWNPHQVRHNAATNLEREYGIDTARIILGHRSPRITQRYIEENHARARDVIACVG